MITANGTFESGGMITANGTFESGGMTYKGSITTDANGAAVSMVADNGKTFN